MWARVNEIAKKAKEYKTKVASSSQLMITNSDYNETLQAATEYEQTLQEAKDTLNIINNSLGQLQGIHHLPTRKYLQTTLQTATQDINITINNLPATITAHRTTTRQAELQKEQHQPNNKLHNYTDIKDIQVINLLNKGPNYIPNLPTDRADININYNEICSALNQFTHSTSITGTLNYISNNIALADTTFDILETASTINYIPTPNTHTQRQTLEALRKTKQIANRPDIHINKADKNLGITINHTQWYNDNYTKLLADKNTYTARPDINTDNLLDYVKQSHIQLRTLLRNLHTDINTKNVRTDDNTTYNTPQLNLLPKVHKLTTPAAPHNEHLTPARPIINAFNWTTTDISRTAEHLFKDLIQSITDTFHTHNITPPTLKSSNHLIERLNNTPVPSTFPHTHTYLVTYDFSSLYTNIKNEHITRLLDRSRIYHFPVHKAQAILAINNFVHSNSIFTAGTNFYTQSNGLSMGCFYAQTCAEAVLLDYEYDLLTRQHTHNTFPILHRYIDDGFTTLHSKASDIQQHLHTLRQAYPHDIPIEFTVHPFTTNFLDLTIYYGASTFQDKHLLYRNYHKPLHAFTYQHFDSDTPQHYRSSIIITEHIRLQRHSKQLTEYKHSMKLFKLRLQRQGYTNQYINHTILQHIAKKEQKARAQGPPQENPEAAPRRVYYKLHYTRNKDRITTHVTQSLHKYRKHGLIFTPHYITNKKLLQYTHTNKKLHAKLTI